jgi:uncharacterized protein YjbJ (UPF0337 family)
VNWDRLEGQWKQQRGKAEHHWGIMMNDELSAVLGKYEELIGRLQEKYGIAKEESKERVVDFMKTVEQLKKFNVRLMKLRKVWSKKKQTKTTMKSKTPSRNNAVKGR